MWHEVKFSHAVYNSSPGIMKQKQFTEVYLTLMRVVY